VFTPVQESGIGINTGREMPGWHCFWPFVVGFTVFAALQVKEYEFAIEQFSKFVDLDGVGGFGEWYDPADGKQWGEPKQGWSAALYARAFQAVRRAGFVKLD
jgi:glycogen debranching enzyme